MRFIKNPVNKYQSEGDSMVLILMAEVNRPGVSWHHIKRAVDCIWRVRFIQKPLEEELNMLNNTPENNLPGETK